MSKEFSLRGNSDFSNRVHDTFKDLLEPKKEPQDSHEYRRPRTPPSTRRRGRPISRPSLPGWRIDPSKYTKYDLSDVELSSERGNAQAAFSFLREVRKRSAEKSPPPPDLDSAKFSFKKPRTKNLPLSKEGPSGSHSKRILPEAHVGERASRKKSPNVSKSTTSKGNLTLSHLQDEEEDEE